MFYELDDIAMLDDVAMLDDINIMEQQRDRQSFFAQIILASMWLK